MKHNAGLLFAFYKLISFARAASEQDPAIDLSPIVDLEYASYKGVYNFESDTKEWYGIRYAQAPTGELRFRAPKDIELSNDYSPSQPIDATDKGPSCVQGFPAWLIPTIIAPGDEDCLLLNVIAPRTANSSSNLTVMVQIHGGGYTMGNADVSPGNALVYQSDGDLIYVSIQYRLGAYGFLGGSEVKKDGDANVGLLDQRAALKWVQRHIAKFGGDPSKVTIIGGSAGGGSVMNQMILNGGDVNPPFRAAMAEYPWWQPYHDDTVLEKQYQLLLDVTHCSSLKCLRQVPPDQLDNAVQSTYLSGYSKGDYGRGDFFYGPYVDGKIIRQLPSQEFEQGHFTKIPLFVNHESEEGIIFTDPTMHTEDHDIESIKTLFPSATPSFISKLLDLYPASDFLSAFLRHAEWFGDFIINCPTYYMATAISKMGYPVYKLRFAAGKKVHGSLVPFVETKDIEGDSDNDALASILRNYYLSFAVTLDPNAKSYTDLPHPYWPTYNNGQNNNSSVIDVTENDITVVLDADDSPRCHFFHNQSSVVRN